MAYEPNSNDNENQSLIKINSGVSTIESKLPALSNGRIPVDISSATLSVTANGVEITNDSGSPIPVTARGGTGMATISTFTSTSSVELRAAASTRKLLTVFNEGAGNLHILYGDGTASTSNYSVRLASGDFLEIENYTGRVVAIFASAGTARVTEIL